MKKTSISNTLKLILFVFFLMANANAAASKFKPEFVKVTITGDEKEIKIKNCKKPEYSYEIGKFEVSNTEYAEFLNSVARLSDPYNLYSPLAETHFWGGIIKLKKPGNLDEWAYYVKKDYELLPVTFVSWKDAARFVNWLHYGKPNIGLSQIGTTEGDINNGAYNTTDETPKNRNINARYFLPTCGEWIFAAYYDPVSKNYMEYAGSNTPPKSDTERSNSRSANYYANKWANKYPHLYAVNGYANNPSPWGTLNQSGNVMEWTESQNSANKIALGGSLFLPQATIKYGYWDSELPNKKISSFGIRVGRKTELQEPDYSFSSNPTIIRNENTSNTLSDSNSKLQQWVKISHPGNFSDYKSGRGCVAYEFEIQATEITNAQYTEFLNSVARFSDKNELFLPDMMFGVAGGINRSKEGNKYTYYPKPGFEKRPVTYLSWFSLARYANWLHYGKPLGNQDIGITEGNSVVGAYNTQDFDDPSKFNEKYLISSLFKRNKNARYFIPNDDEWYKAAYYDPSKTGFSKYWIFPNKSNTSPSNKKSENNSLNFQHETLGEGPPFYISNVGEYTGTGYFNVYDMGGNVWEWIEDWKNIRKDDCWRCETPAKGLRGGSFNYIDIGLNSSNIDPGNPADHYFVYGGRVARSIPTKLSWCIPYENRIEAYRLASLLYRYKLAIITSILFIILLIFYKYFSKYKIYRSLRK